MEALKKQQKADAGDDRQDQVSAQNKKQRKTRKHLQLTVNELIKDGLYAIASNVYRRLKTTAVQVGFRFSVFPNMRSLFDPLGRLAPSATGGISDHFL